MVGRISLGAELGAVGATRLIEDGSGITVRQRLAPSVGVNAKLPIPAGADLGVALRAAPTEVAMERSRERWSGGSAMQYDLVLSVGHRLLAGFDGRLGVAGSVLVGPNDVVPFRRHGGEVWLWGSEVGLSRRIASLPFRIGVDTQLLRLGSQRGEDPVVKGGWIARARLGLGYAR
jgi:hypothetical protein